MNRKQIGYYLIAWCVGAAYLWFQYKNPEIFSGTVNMFASWGLGGALVIGTLMAIIKSIPFLHRPLWGFEKTPTGYRDTSIEKYPYIVLALLGVIIASFLFSLTL